MSLFHDQLDTLFDHDLAVSPEHRILPASASIGTVDLFVSIPAPEPPLLFSVLQAPLGPSDLAIPWNLVATPLSQATETPSPARDALPLFPSFSPPHAWSLPLSTLAQFPSPASYADAEPFHLYLPPPPPPPQQQQQQSALGLTLGRPASPPPAFAPQSAPYQPMVPPQPPALHSPVLAQLPAPPSPPPSTRKTTRSTQPRPRNPHKRVIDATELSRNLCLPRARKGADGKRVCTIAGCGVRVTAEQLKRHIETHFPQDKPVCTYPGCGKRYSRKDSLHRHRKTNGHEED